MSAEDAEEVGQSSGAGAEQSHLCVFLGTLKNSEVIEQAKAPQAHILVVLVLFLIPVLLLRWLTQGLMSIDSFARVCASHPQTYRSVFFALQVVIILFLGVYFGCRYSTALRTPGAKISKRQLGLSGLVLLPLVAWYLLNLPSFFFSLSMLMEMRAGPDRVEVIADLHERVWGQLAYGSSGQGIIFASVLSLVVPFYEEMFITGFVGNFVTKRAGLTAAIILIPCVFAAAHVPAFGFGKHLIGLLCAGACYMLIRVLTGSVRYSIAAHVVVNIVIFIPKWIIAVVHFLASGG